MISPPTTTAAGKDDSLEGVDIKEYPELESIISDASGTEQPKDGIMDWVKDLYLRSRGRELSTFGGSILSSALKNS